MQIWKDSLTKAKEENAATRRALKAAVAAEAKEMALMQARMDIASQFRTNYVLHHVLTSWRVWHESQLQERSLMHTREQLQQRMDGMLVRARQRQATLYGGGTVSSYTPQYSTRQEPSQIISESSAVGDSITKSSHQVNADLSSEKTCNSSNLHDRSYGEHAACLDQGDTQTNLWNANNLKNTTALPNEPASCHGSSQQGVTALYNSPLHVGTNCLGSDICSTTLNAEAAMHEALCLLEKTATSHSNSDVHAWQAINQMQSTHNELDSFTHPQSMSAGSNHAATFDAHSQSRQPSLRPSSAHETDSAMNIYPCIHSTSTVQLAITVRDADTSSIASTQGIVGMTNGANYKHETSAKKHAGKNKELFLGANDAFEDPPSQHGSQDVASEIRQLPNIQTELEETEVRLCLLIHTVHSLKHCNQCFADLVSNPGS